jgi:hypothetical protein
MAGLPEEEAPLPPLLAIVGGGRGCTQIFVRAHAFFGFHAEA